MFSDGITFKIIYPDYDTFLQDLENYDIVNESTTEHEKLYHEYFYNILLARYCNDVINYDYADAFKRNFMLQYYDIYFEYIKKIELIDEMYKLNNEDLEVVDYTISSVALNDNGEKNPLTDIINFISNQAISKHVQNKATAYIYAIDKIQNKLIHNYLEIFNKHFQFLYVDPTYYFEED